MPEFKKHSQANEAFLTEAKLVAALRIWLDLNKNQIDDYQLDGRVRASSTEKWIFFQRRGVDPAYRGRFYLKGDVKICAISGKVKAF